MRIYLHAKFENKFDTLPQNLRDKFFERASLFRQNPYHTLLHNHSVDRAYPGCRSINVTGDYRAIFKEASDGIVFLRIGTHPELYG